MGSTGTGSFGDYYGVSEPTKDMCRKNIDIISLEEVGRLEYFNKYNDVPEMMDRVVLSDKAENGRLVVLVENTGEKLGLLPSKHANLLACMRKGFSYRGNVIFSTLKPLPKVDVNLNAEE